MPNLDLWPLLEQLTIKTKTAEIKKLRRDDPFAWAQREFVSEIERQYNQGLPVRIVVLKGRQLGLSTLTEAVLFIWCFLHPGTNAMVLSKEQNDSEYLASMTKRYWEQGPFMGLFPTKYNRLDYMEWDGINSSILIDTAKKADVGRGRTIQAAHCSEVAFWDNADEITASLGEAIPYQHGTIVIYESTANGVGGMFHDEWMKAIDPEDDKSVFTPMFFPWWEHEEYAVAKTHLKYGDLDEEERDLLSTYPKLTMGKLAWRRRKLTTYANPEKFKEEYPMCPEEAFLSTGSNVFPLTKLAACYDPSAEVEQGYLYQDGAKLEWVDDPNGHTWVYKRPDPRLLRRYVVACDPTWTVEGDPACIQVMDRASMEQVAVWHGSADPEWVGAIALAMARWYGPSTILNTEVQGGGKAVMRIWREAHWPNIWLDRRTDRIRQVMQAYGWQSTYEQKKLLLATMQGVMHRKTLLIHHPATYYELTHYINNEDGTYGPARRSGHDDTVISLGIAIMTCVTEIETLDYTAMAAPPPLYIPGQTPPHIADMGRTVEPMDLTRFAMANQRFEGEEWMGIEETY
jgi:hypothetical protein